MMQSETFPPAIFLMGPTASGKSALALELAKQLDSEIISVDSALVYRGMDIGTAKPTQMERQIVRHHLIDILDPVETYSTGRFKQQALQLMQTMTEQDKIPILVGGTMLYFNALFYGLAELPTADPILRQKLDEALFRDGKIALHQRLKSIDPESAQRIHPNDPQRIQRALEVFELTGKPLSQFFHEAKQQTFPFKTIKIIIAPEDRALLHDKIAVRFKQMLKQGLLDEVRMLYQRGDLNKTMPAMRAVGYRQVWQYLDGEYDWDKMVEKAIIATRQLAKRQFTWLRRETDAVQFSSSKFDLTEQVYRYIQTTL